MKYFREYLYYIRKNLYEQRKYLQVYQDETSRTLDKRYHFAAQHAAQLTQGKFEALTRKSKNRCKGDLGTNFANEIMKLQEIWGCDLIVLNY